MKYAKLLPFIRAKLPLGKIITVILHEGSHPLGYFRNQIPNLRYWNESFQKTGDWRKLEKLLSIADGIEKNMEFFVTLFGKLDPLAAGKHPAKQATGPEENHREYTFHL